MTEAKTVEPPNEEPTTFRHTETGREVRLRMPGAIRSADASPLWERAEDPAENPGEDPAPLGSDPA